EARWLAGPSQLRRYGMRTGRFLPLLPPDEAAAHPHFAAAQTMPTASIVGTADEVTAGLHELAERTQASELMLYTATYGLPERLNSLELIAHAWPTRPTADADGEDATADHGHAMMPGAVAGGGGRG
ncbi:MAG: hypothetical protein OEY70_01810, partial [Acidimicrobiia bacterium]|nr:hypothetical protein [Acidimicrobiia bacterium]